MGAFQFGEFFTDFGEDAMFVGPVEANLGSLFLELGGTEDGGQAFAGAVEIRFFLVAFFTAFDGVPLLKYGIRRSCVALRKDVRVTAHEFVGDSACDIVERVASGFLGEFAVKDHLQEQVAEFLHEVFVVLALDGVDRFVGLFDQIRNDRLVSLFRIPRAATGRAQAVHDGTEAVNLPVILRAVDHFGIGHESLGPCWAASRSTSRSRSVRLWKPSRDILSRMRSTSESLSRLMTVRGLIFLSVDFLRRGVPDP